VLACGTTQQLGQATTWLVRERIKPGDSPAWLVAVLLQKIHGIDPGIVRARRAELRLVRSQARDRAAQEVTDLNTGIATAAAARKL
jgi:hypothetical protein